MKSLYHYLADAMKTYKYRVKTTIKIDNNFVKTLNDTLYKYDIKSISKPSKMMAQNAPLDFRDLGVVEIYYVDIETHIPAVSYLLANDLRKVFNVTPELLVVRGSNEPIELEAKEIERLAKEDKDQDALLNIPEYGEYEEPKEVTYGDSYNNKLLDYLAQVKSTSDKKLADKLMPFTKISQFEHLSNYDVAEDFNKDFDTVKSVHVNTKKPSGKIKQPNLTSPSDNYDASIRSK